MIPPVLRNRQRRHRLNLPLLRQITNRLIETILPGSSLELAIHLVNETFMARLNRQFLNHEGSTDVITFSYLEEDHRYGEIFISVPDAIRQAAVFNTTWQEEIVRYLAHGLLHLAGHDDLDPTRRRTMKRAENRALELIRKRFPISSLGNPQARLPDGGGR